MEVYLPFERRLFFRTVWAAIFIVAYFAATPWSFVSAQNQEQTVRGSVTESGTGAPIPGVNVLVKGTAIGTTTDAEGRYTISFAGNDGTTLVFSFIGFVTREQQVGQQSNIDVQLQPDVTSLDEVVVIGSTLSSSKRQLGNTVTTVSSESLQKSGTNNLFGALQGKVAGAQITQTSGDPSGGMTVRLRGVKSLSGNSDPLYVIDGVIVSNSTTNVSQRAVTSAGVSVGTNRMADINPNDIESISVLSGAAASAIYGSRAINGVVVITTKRGQNGKPRITFSTSFNVNELRKKVPFTTYGKQFASATQIQHSIADPAKSVDSIFVEGNLNPDRYLATNLVDVKRYDYQDQIFRTGYGTDNYLSMSGGNEKTDYLISTSYMKNEGIIRGTDFRRYGLKLRLNQRITDWAKLSAGVSYTNSFANEKPNGNVFYSPINSMTITNNIYDLSQRDAFGNLKAVDGGRVNPLSVIEEFDFNQTVNRTISDVKLIFTPLSGLTIDLLGGVDIFAERGYSYIPPYAYTVNSNLYPNGFAASAVNNAFLANIDMNATYEKDFDNFKSITVGGFNYQYNRSDFSGSSGEGVSRDIKSVSGASTNLKALYELDRFNIYGGFLQQTVGYKNLAFITAAGRIDGSSKFDKEQTNQFYGKLSGSIILSDFTFWDETLGSAVNNFKLRAALGEAGGLNAIGSYDRFQAITAGQLVNKNAYVPSSTLANSDVKPERMRELEAGIDIAFLQNRFILGLTAYKQKISDLIVEYVVASSSGGTRKIDNVGEMENKGIEISLGTSIVRNSNWGWDINVIYSANRNKITELGSPRLQINNDAGAPVYHIEGEPASVFYGTYFARDVQGNLLYAPNQQFLVERGNATTNEPQRGADGLPSGDGIRKIIGNPNPDYTASLSSTLWYKGLSFGFLLDAVHGYDVFNADRRTRQGIGNGEYAEREMKGELPRGYIWSSYSIEEWRIEDGSFVKLREVSLSYNFPNFIKGLSNLQLSLIGRNLYSWDSYEGYDPETNAGNTSDRFRATDFGNVPIPRTYQIKLTGTF
jgi:TonB-linked SusC/RagA family outer membrane protein